MKIGWQVDRQSMGNGQHTGAAVLLPVGCVIWPKGMDPPERAWNWRMRSNSAILLRQAPRCKSTWRSSVRRPQGRSPPSGRGLLYRTAVHIWYTAEHQVVQSGAEGGNAGNRPRYDCTDVLGTTASESMHYYSDWMGINAGCPQKKMFVIHSTFKG